MQDNNKKKFAVIGNPIAHSLSPYIHYAFAKQTNKAIIYEKIQAEDDNFEAILTDFFNNGGKGLNITLPFKKRAFEWVEIHHPSAHSSHSVNTIYIENGKIMGANTDGMGLVWDIKSNLHWDINNCSVLILGAGGATQGVIPSLLDNGCQKISIYNRTFSKAKKLENFFNTSQVIAIESKIALSHLQFDLIINGTSANFSGQSLDIPKEIIKKSKTYCYDMNYTKSSFCVWSKALQAKQTSLGWGMLVGQAAEAFNLWHKIYPNPQLVLDNGTPHLPIE